MCDWPDCRDTGDHRAPRSRDRLDEFHWFCLDHVRIYNRAWNYYVGMSDQEVEACVRSDTTWNRPSWPFAGAQPEHWSFDDQNIDDPFGVLGRDGKKSGHMPPAELSGPQRQALADFDLDFPVTIDEVKARYKELVKRHHPDANGGAKKAEERIKRVNRAYDVLTKELFS